MVPPLTGVDFITQHVSALHAFAVVDLLFPQFVEVDGYVFLADKFDSDRFAEWCEYCSGDMRRVQAVINHLHLWDVFSSEQMSEDSLTALAAWIGMCWTIAAEATYPNYSYHVEVTNRIADYGSTLTLYSGNEPSS